MKSRSVKLTRCSLGAVAFLIFTQFSSAQTKPEQPPVKAEKKKLATGPEVGQKIPYFRASDQHGKMQDLTFIRGPKGGMIVFFRSADW